MYTKNVIFINYYSCFIRYFSILLFKRSQKFTYWFSLQSVFLLISYSYCVHRFLFRTYNLENYRTCTTCNHWANDNLWCILFNDRTFSQCKSFKKKEGRRFSNSLTLILGSFILLYLVLSIVDPERFIPSNFGPIFGGIYLICLYFFIHVLTFLTSYFLYQFNKPKYNQDFIIVLGSGLINDKVPPLLASRINKAIDFYWKQMSVGSPPTIIFSGGQGPDENLPEAEAMQKYAIEKGIPIEHTIQENRSVNTYENMLFSKQIMDTLKSKYNSIFTTNNFHLFRAGLYAKQAGLSSQGIGSKTAFYYWPNAMIREYIALVVINRKRHLNVVSFILVFSILLTMLNFIIDYYL